MVLKIEWIALAMVRGDIHNLDGLLERPLFADELGNPNPLDGELMEILEINHFRIVPPKSAMEGVYGIYFFSHHVKEAIIRYAERYRWIFEILLRAGMRGEQILKGRGFTDEAIEFLREIVPNIENGINPVVYQILWDASDHEKYLDLASELQDEGKFTPREIIDRSDNLSQADIGCFHRFIRNYLIESMEAVRTKRHHHGGAGGDNISVDLDAEYHLTQIGEKAIPAILSEYERIFIDKGFEPLKTGRVQLPPREPSPDPYADVQIATSDDDDVLAVDEYKQTSISDYD